MNKLTTQFEAQRLLQVYHGENQWDRLMGHMSDQMTVLQNRAQMLLALSAVTITVTGFSGRTIAATSFSAQLFVVIGLGLVILAAGICVFGVLNVKWMTLINGDEIEEWLHNTLIYRDRKTKAYKLATFVLLLGLIVYGCSVALMLLEPTLTLVR